jgi:hypothetical protein
MEIRKYPVDVQTFKKIRTGNYVYVDKTGMMYDLAQKYQYVFLSRPRRFGKTLLTTTFESYFSGEKELFNGLKVGELEKDWVQYPVLHFSMNGVSVSEVSQLNDYISVILEDQEKKYGLSQKELAFNTRFKRLIDAAKAQTGHSVVVLIDEYDKPMLDAVDNEPLMKKVRAIMRNFYTPLKERDTSLRFVFLTGITKFSQLSIFSELNNLKNISMYPEYAAICGITGDEIKTQLGEDVDRFAKFNGITSDEAFRELKNRYDGYHFSSVSPDIFNPFSLINAFDEKSAENFWFSSGTPAFLIKTMQKFGVPPEKLGRQEAWQGAFDAPTENMTAITPLLYQSGYITIKGYDRSTRIFTLDVPNQEVKEGLMFNLLPYVVPSDSVTGAQMCISEMYLSLQRDDFDQVMFLLKKFLGTIPSTNNTNYEGHYQSILFVIFSLMSKYVNVEVHTPQGRVDIVLESPNKLYVIEIKLDKGNKKAAEQIDLKQYDERFALSGKPIVNVGVNFSSKTRNITAWMIKYRD